MSEKKKEIRGKAVALGETIVTFFLLGLAFCGIEAVKDGWERIGGTYATIFLGSLGIWMTTKAAKSIGSAFAKAKEIALQAKEEASYEKTV